MSNLIDQASLVMIPSGYKEDKIYSQVPTDGSGDLTFTRASDGTRVNSQGLVERVPWNLLQQSNSFSTSPWSAINATLTSGQSGYDGSSNAWLITDNATSGSHLIRQTPSKSGQLTISVYAKANTLNWLWLRGVQSSANVRAWFNLSTGTIGTVETNGTAKMQSVGNGWYQCSLTIANFQSGFEVYIATSSGDNTEAYVGSGQSIYIQDAQLNEGTTAKPYFPTTDRQNVPRLDYSNGCPSLLLEPQRTNLFTYSEQFDQSFWTKSNTTVTPNTTISPDGSQNADTMTTVASTSRIIDTTVYAAGTYTASVYVKRLTGDDNFQFRFVVDGANQTKNFDVTTEWQRFTFTVTAGTELRDLQFRSNATGTGTFAIWGAQLEAGSYATSYIPTTSATVTRVADTASKTGISSLIGQTEGAIFWDMEYFDPDRYLSIADTTGSSNNYLLLWHTSNIPRIALRGSGTNAVVNTISSYPSTPNTRYKYAVSWTSGGDFYVYRNGVQIFSTTIGTLTLSAPFDAIKFADRDDSPTFDGKINQTLSFTSALTNSELAALTTL